MSASIFMLHDLNFQSNKKTGYSMPARNRCHQ